MYKYSIVLCESHREKKNKTKNETKLKTFNTIQMHEYVYCNYIKRIFGVLGNKQTNKTEIYNEKEKEDDSDDVDLLELKRQKRTVY